MHDTSRNVFQDHSSSRLALVDDYMLEVNYIGFGGLIRPMHHPTTRLQGKMLERCEMPLVGGLDHESVS